MYFIDNRAIPYIAPSLSDNIKGSVNRMSHLINAALVDPVWCRLLLTDPAAALTKGPNGEYFNLPPRVRHYVLNARAATLAEFAQGWLRYIDG